jgi:diacylglycerol kinase family enzyme
LRGLPKVFKGTHVETPWLTFLKAREVTLAADRPFEAYADGDPITPLPVTVKVEPGALQVLAP